MNADNEKNMRAAFESAYSSSVLIRNTDGTYQISGIRKEYEIFVRGWKALARDLFDQMNEQIAKHEATHYSIGYRGGIPDRLDTPYVMDRSWHAAPFLLRASYRSVDQVTVNVRTLKDKILGRHGQDEKHPGKITWSDAIIDFGTEVMVPLYQKISKLQFGDRMYFGITPIAPVEKFTNRFICRIDYVERI
jgi:hypothetical protein